jgi:hypothetical protein
LYFQATSFGGDLVPLPTGLIEFDCSFTLISGGLVNENFAGLDSLNYALFDGNAYNSSVPTIFGLLPNLEYLYLSNAFLSGDLSYMRGMPAIIEHWLDINAGVTGTIPTAIGELETLLSFSVTQTSIFGTIPSELGGLTNMFQMWLYANDLTGSVPTELGLLTAMTLLQLEGNELAGSMPAEICNNIGFLKPLEILGSPCSNGTGFTVRVDLPSYRVRNLLTSCPSNTTTNLPILRI